MINININLSAIDNIRIIDDKIKQLQEQQARQLLINKANEIQILLDNYITDDTNIYKLIIKKNKIIGIEKTSNRL